MRARRMKLKRREEMPYPRMHTPLHNPETHGQYLANGWITFEVRDVEVAVLDGGEVAEPNEQPKENAIHDQVALETAPKRNHKNR